MIKRILNLKRIALIALLGLPVMAFAVTQKEMEQARTIAAKAYIRYANDGSGYLDDLNPATMEELEGALKTKEKENIKAFKAIPVPSDYKDWDKEKLVDYWAVKAFQTKGLLEKGRGGRIRARSQISKMNIAAPQAEASVSPVSPVAETLEPQTVPSDSTAGESSQLSQLKADEQAVIDAEENYEEEPNVDKASNYTWVYIMVLAILVAIVVALVVYAANVMKRNGARSAEERQKHAEDSEALEHYESLVADKDSEISMLKKKLESLNKQNSDLKKQLDTLTSELAMARTARTTVAPDLQRKDTNVETEVQKTGVRSIYLGRANMKGIFVRADRNLNVGNSVFVLDTTDGFSGTFRVADSPDTWNLALSNPKEYLETACTGYGLNDTRGVSKIVTESAGTAIFEGGCWRVIRKARISYQA